jgi:Aldo/keto reductases, related to diketogulonate reductase
MLDFILNNGVKMPALGFGTYKIPGPEAERCVLDALSAGYGRIDTATLYDNEEYIGYAVEKSGIPRKNIFLTTKFWTDVRTYDRALKSFSVMLKKLRTDYLDLLLIHWPIDGKEEVWRAMENLNREGSVRAIGVSNFKERHIDEIMKAATIAPAVNQVEFHPLFQQIDLLNYCKKRKIQLEAWSPLLRGKALAEPVLQKIAAKHDKTPAQVILRYDIQIGVAVIPKSTHRERIIENIDVFDFELSDGDTREIASINRNERQFRDPDNHGF